MNIGTSKHSAHIHFVFLGFLYHSLFTFVPNVLGHWDSGTHTTFIFAS